ncbi:hypothetical protein [Frankia sp. CiP1_Cm_nod2]|uniref:hypothetical protein n=1 Tax=Frankia sp. CiP1_Cm_nod2 TaxID=2897161 RepID=UPI0020250C54
MVHRPVNRRLVVVDIEGSSERDTPTQVDLRHRLKLVVEDGLDAVGLSARHGTAPSIQDRYDSLLIAIDPAVSLADLTDTFLDRLATALRHDRKRASPAARMRLRVAIHDGDVLIDDDVISGRHAVEVCRLVDADPLREAFTAAPEADLAVIVSDRVYQSVVAEDYGRVPPSAYQRVDVTIKSLRTRAWIYVPNADGWRQRPGAPTPPPFPGRPGKDSGQRDADTGQRDANTRRDSASGDVISGNIVIIGSHLDEPRIAGRDIGCGHGANPFDEVDGDGR